MKLPRSVALALSIWMMGCSAKSAGTAGVGGGTAGGGASTGGGSSGSTGAAPPTVSGIVIVRGLGEGTAFKVERYSQPRANVAPSLVGDGHCAIVAAPDDGDFQIWGSLPAGDVDLGSVTLTAPNLTLDAGPSGSGSFEYLAAIAGSYVFDEAVTLANSGVDGGAAASTLAAVRVPGQVFPIPSEVATTPAPFIVSWSGGDGAQFFHLRIETPDHRIDCYPPPTATQLELPPEVMAVLPARVTPLVSAERLAYLQTDAGPVLVRVSSDNLD